MFHLRLLLSTVQLLLIILTATHSPTMTALENNLNSHPCSVLSSLLPGKVSYPGDATYTTSDSSYFFQQARLSPQCIIRPESAQDVSLIVKTLGKLQSKAAIRGGGHTPFAGAANINTGVTIDLSGMNTVTLNAGQEFDILRQSLPHSSSPWYSGNPRTFSSNCLDNTSSGTPDVKEPNLNSVDDNAANKGAIVSVGGGASWGQVYTKLKATGVVPVGGRGFNLGVGGLTTGGGISFFSPQRGFACDNVLNMQIVLADGSLVNANNNEHPDLFRALKGGSNNFGIVTRFDLHTYPQGDFWGGFITYPGSTVPQQLAAFAGFMQAEKNDPYAEVIFIIGYLDAYKSIIALNGLYYTKPIANPPIFRAFTVIQPQLSSTTRISNNLDFVNEIEAGQAKSPRGIYVNTIFRPTAAIIQKVHQLWSKTITSISHVEGIAHLLILQRLPATRPGNSLGLDVSEDDSLVLLLLSITWTKSKDDTLINSVAQTLIEDIDHATKAAGLFKSFKYLNYAADFQDPIGGYGARSKAELRAMSQKYDPNGFFQSQVPGGFKLFATAAEMS